MKPSIKDKIMKKKKTRKGDKTSRNTRFESSQELTEKAV